MNVWNWLLEIDRTESWLARQTGMNPSHLWRALRGERPLPEGLAKRIEQLSNGKVLLTGKSEL